MNKIRIELTVASLLLASLVGCAGLNDHHYETTQKARAVREYIRCGNAKCEKHPHDYKIGWIDGFYNIATGGPTCPPAVAPSRYWNPKQILDDCDNRRHSYYSGWQDGAARASAFPDTHHLKIFETCECPMPRCESSCGGNCGPCGMNFIGSPVHQELIEMPYETETVVPTPVVPPAPVSDDDDGDDPSAELPEPAAASVIEQTSSEAPAELAMLETKDLDETETVTSAQSNQALVEDHDAGSIFGSAFDVTQSAPSAVRLQESDPIDNLGDETDVENTSVGSEPSEASEEVAAIEPTIVLPKPNVRSVEPSEGTVRHVEEISIPETQQVAESTGTSKTDFANPKTSPAVESNGHATVAIEAVPVGFEMIESDQPTVRLAK